MISFNTNFKVKVINTQIYFSVNNKIHFALFIVHLCIYQVL